MNQTSQLILRALLVALLMNLECQADSCDGVCKTNFEQCNSGTSTLPEQFICFNAQLKCISQCSRKREAKLAIKIQLNRFRKTGVLKL